MRGEAGGGGEKEGAWDEDGGSFFMFFIGLYFKRMSALNMQGQGIKRKFFLRRAELYQRFPSTDPSRVMWSTSIL